MTIGHHIFDKKGRYKNGSYYHVGWIGRDGRVELRDDIGVYQGWNLVQGKIRFYPQDREDSRSFYYGEAYQTSDFYLYIYK